MRDKPRLLRDDVLRQERHRRRSARCLDRLAELVDDDELLGTPYRRGDRIVVPVRTAPRDASDGAREEEESHSVLLALTPAAFAN